MPQSIFFDVIARDKASSTFSRVGRSSDSAHGKLLRLSKSTLGAAAGFTSVTLAAGAFVRVGADYVGSLNKIQALTDANDATIKRSAQTLESQASSYAKMGQTVGDAAGGVVELTKAGLSLDKSLKAVSATMVLAKAGELSVADASSLVANTLNTFGLKASRAGDIANYLANAANISSADVSDLAESLKYVAPVAASTGVSLKQTNAILAELSNSGIAASNAGTGFRKFLLSLQAPSGAAARDLKGLNIEIFDAQGKMKPLGQVIDILNGKLSKLTDEKRQKILKDVFGLQGVSAAQVILKNGAAGLEKYTKGVEKAGAAQRLAQAASKGFAGTLSALRAEVISGAQAAYRDLSPSLDDAAKKVLAFVEQMKSGKGAGGDFVDVLKTLASVGKTALKILDDLPGPVKRFGAEGLIAYAVLRKLTSASSGFGASLASPIARSKQFYAELTYTETRMQRVATVSRRLGEGLRQVGGTAGMLAVVDGAKRSNHALGALEMTAGGIAAGFAIGGPVGAAVGGAVGYFGALAKEVKDTGGAAKNSLSSWRDYAGTLDDVSAATTRATRAMILERLEKTGLLRQTQALNISDRDAVQAALGNEAARKRVSAALGEAVAQGKNYQALKIAQNLGVETTAIYSSRVAQLKKNLALAATKEEAQKIQAKLDRLAKTNANPSIRIAGAGTAISQLTAIQQLLHDVTGKKGGNAQPPKSGSLLGQLSGRATGGPVIAGQPYVVGDAGRPELFVPSSNGRIVSQVPTGLGGGGIELEQTLYRAVSRALADGRMVILPRSQVSDIDLLVGTT